MKDEAEQSNPSTGSADCRPLERYLNAMNDCELSDCLLGLASDARLDAMPSKFKRVMLEAAMRLRRNSREAFSDEERDAIEGSIAHAPYCMRERKVPEILQRILARACR